MKNREVDASRFFNRETRAPERIRGRGKETSMAEQQDRRDEQGKNTADYYKLKSDAVDALVNANEENSPEVSPEELAKYKKGSKLKLPKWLKILFVKFWFNGAVCYFFIWGLGLYITDVLDLLLVTGLGLGVVTDLLVNGIFRYYADPEGSNDRYMMFPKKKLINLFLNVLYAYIVLFFVYTLYGMINGTAAQLSGNSEQIVLGVGPICFGLFYLGFDMLFIGMKRLMIRIIEDAKKKV